MSRKRLIVFFDGTWNDPIDKTNVYRLAKMVSKDAGDVEQHFFYDEGVGTFTSKIFGEGHISRIFSQIERYYNKARRVIAGYTGYGLTENLIQGYQWLCENYEEGDEIWLFGFSRGAYTARSLAGLIDKCGLLKIPSKGLLKAAELHYRNKKNPNKALKFKKDHSLIINQIHFIGVWDTVGALGGRFYMEKYKWHNTQLSNKVKYAYHAVALDEHRKVYDTVLWTSPDGALHKPTQTVEQVWFMGAHADIGGGYEDDHLSNITLNWMVEKATSAGLKLNTKSLPKAGNLLDKKPTDSYLTFLNCAYAVYSTIRQAISNFIDSTTELTTVIDRLGFVSKAAYSAFFRFSTFDKKASLSKKYELGRYQRQLYRNHKGEMAVNVSVHPSLISKWRHSHTYVLPFVNHYVDLEEKLSDNSSDTEFAQFVGAIDE